MPDFSVLSLSLSTKVWHSRKFAFYRLFILIIIIVVFAIRSQAPLMLFRMLVLFSRAFSTDLIAMLERKNSRFWMEWRVKRVLYSI